MFLCNGSQHCKRWRSTTSKEICLLCSGINYRWYVPNVGRGKVSSEGCRELCSFFIDSSLTRVELSVILDHNMKCMNPKNNVCTYWMSMSIDHWGAHMLRVENSCWWMGNRGTEVISDYIVTWLGIYVQMMGIWRIWLGNQVITLLLTTSILSIPHSSIWIPHY